LKKDLFQCLFLFNREITQLELGNYKPTVLSKTHAFESIPVFVNFIDLFQSNLEFITHTCEFNLIISVESIIVFNPLDI